MNSKQTDKTVYFLGAGASNASDFKLPLMKGFFQEDVFSSGEYKNLKKFIEKYFSRGFINELNMNELNMEEVITMLELSLDKFGSLGNIPETYLFDAKREFGKYVIDRLKLPLGNNLCSKHSILAKNIKRSDTIISLNYDEIMEIALTRESLEEVHVWNSNNLICPLAQDTSAGEIIPSLSTISLVENEGYFLRLHGSINWLYCPNPDCWLHLSFYPNIWNRAQADAPCIYCGTPISPVIVPPTMKKAFEEYPRLGIIWAVAYREIKNANKIVFIGLSLAESDYYLNWMIKSAVYNSNEPKIIEVVNKDKSVCEKIKKLVGIEPTFLGDFDTYIEKLKEQNL